ncbi:hypothetical protein EJ02DRAFT_340666 [Clathrospora elynae]|uniref:Zn(2)-C6 fungal-type domain-containing protein n=1 Tax=Clathrospora elynae TaxID=706981 RepID=A0A6A5SXX8_9PLEO|nr:hypothetical protein EJ02DRAFT_340666 [Clathrospora elynae]
MGEILAIPENTMVATGSNREPKPRKMRASCDACSRAKVKCDKIRPTCHRCGNMNICCNYSPSMRLGKPRRNRNPDGTIMRDVSPVISCGPLTRPDMIPRTTSFTAESSPEPTDPFFFGPGTPEYHYQDAFMGSGFDGSQSPAYSDGTGSLVNGWSNEDHMMFGSPAEMFAPMPHFLQPHPPYAGHIRSTSLQSQPEMFSPIEALPSPPIASPHFFGMPDPMFAHQDKIMASPPPIVSAPLPTPLASNSLPNHDCTQFAFQTLNSLYAPPESQPSSGDFNGTLDGLPTLDAVISTNTAAVDKLYILLGCPCSSNPHFSTTIAFTIVKILSWYQAIAGGNSEDSQIEAQREAFTHTHISLGAFTLEAEEEETLRTNLVLSELRKVEKLIDKFSERYCKSANPSSLGIDGGVYVALEALLRTRVRDTFKITMRNAPDKIKRQLASRTHNRVRVNTM